MILKLKEENNWKFIDNVKDCSISEDPNDKEGEMKGHICRYTVGSEHLTIFITETAYLLNNEGKTVERLVL